MDVNTRLTTLIDLVTELTALVEEENDALRHMRVQKVEELVGRKEALGKLYAEHGKALAEETAAWPEGATAAKQQLAGLVQRFEALSAENMTLLKAAAEINEKLIRAIADAVREQMPNAAGYSEKGTVGSYGRHGVRPRSVALSLNQTL